MTMEALVVEITLTPEVKDLSQHYKALNHKCLVIEKHYPQELTDENSHPSREYRWCKERMSEITQKLGTLFTAQITGIKR